METCICCSNHLHLQWSDTHGIGVCTSCGMPYRIYHYDDEKRRVDKPPEPALTTDGISIAKRYWAERCMRVFPAYFDIGFCDGCSFSGATPEEVEAFSKWYASAVKPTAQEKRTRKAAKRLAIARKDSPHD